MFDQIIELQSTQDAICRAALEELQRRLQFEDKKKQREAEGQWGVTAAEEEQENQRIREFRESIPKMCSQLRILTHFYQGVVQQFLVLLTTSSDEPALPELQAGLQRALPGTGAEAACVPGCPGPAQLPHLRPSAGGRPGNVPGTPARPEVGRASRQRN